MFTANDVKELREKTGAGMMDCKKALDASKGNMEEAITWLREKGISKAEKKASRIAAEGLTYAESKANTAVIAELNCETDFVARNEQFKDLITIDWQMKIIMFFMLFILKIKLILLIDYHKKHF